MNRAPLPPTRCLRCLALRGVAEGLHEWEDDAARLFHDGAELDETDVRHYQPVGRFAPPGHAQEPPRRHLR